MNFEETASEKFGFKLFIIWNFLLIILVKYYFGELIWDKVENYLLLANVWQVYLNILHKFKV